jgi:hypothetical protein
MQHVVPAAAPGRYADPVARRRVSAALDDDEVRLARELAEEDGISLSAWVARAIRTQLRHEDGLRAVDEYEAEHGPLPKELLDLADETLDRLRIGVVPRQQ